MVDAQYFGIPEEESTREMEERILDVDSLEGLERGARSLARTAMHSAGFNDVEELQDAIRTGAMKLGAFLERYG